GILHESILGKSLRHILAVSGMDTDFKNPFITNFEERDEASLSIRSYFELKGNETKNIRWKWNLGIEWQKTNSGISNYGNRNGVKDTIQSSDRIKARQYFWFSRFSADIRERLILEASLSLNNYQYRYLNNFPVAETAFRLKRFSPQLMPKLSTSFKISEGLLWRSSVSRGYSPPTIAEVRPSDNNLYADLKPEAGWNYESGLRAKTASERFYIDLTFFYYQLQNAIVRRVNSLGADYYVNAGGTQQSGAEVLSRLQLLPSRDGGLFRKLELRNSITLYHFKFSDYQNASADYSDHWLTGVPPLSVVSSISTEAGRHLYLFIQHTYTDRIPLNDDNSVYASSWHLLQAKAGWKFNLKIQAELFIGADNILNQRYSLGNDLNALGGRYYNAAPPRNFYAGMNMEF
ncbi:MAG: TonB-dependent receptor, partial [Cytophagaceae bacterium]